MDIHYIMKTDISELESKSVFEASRDVWNEFFISWAFGDIVLCKLIDSELSF